MIKQTLLILFIALPLINGHSQNSILNYAIESSNYIAGNFEYIQTEFVFTNNSYDYYILWLDENNNDSLDNKQRIKKYFFTLKGDFTLCQLLYETLAEEPLSHLYLLFYKIIPPKDQFTISILIRKDYPNYEMLIKSIKNQIVTINSKELTIPTLQDLSRFNYKGKSIALTGDMIKFNNN